MLHNLIQRLEQKPLLKTNLILSAIGILKIPVIAFLQPRAVELSSTRSVIRIRLGYRSRNHLGAMYFGALAVGAELSVAMPAVEQIQKTGKKIDLLFKSFSCDFLKRADDDTHFVCEQSHIVSEMISLCAQSNERIERELEGYAYVPSKSPEPVMRYKLVLSLKNRSPLL